MAGQLIPAELPDQVDPARNGSQPPLAESRTLGRQVSNRMDDELRPEYDLQGLRVRKLGPGRTSFGGSVVRLEPDVAEVFPDAESVNEALKFLIRVTKDNNPTVRNPRGDA